MDEIIKKLDLYELLEIDIRADSSEIKKAYRKKALKCHPDKNPDDPKAADTFRQLSKALEILSDDVARAAYNKILVARKEAALRTKAMDSNRKKMKEELEAKERVARQQGSRKSQESDEEQLRREIERLRREGSKILKQENEFIRQQIEKEIEELQLAKETLKLPRLKCKWDRKSPLDEPKLRKLLENCGKVSCLVISKKANSAIVEFETTEAAISAYNLRNEHLEVEWMQGKPVNLNKTTVPLMNFNNYATGRKRCNFDNEYEQIVLNKLRNAQKIKFGL